MTIEKDLKAAIGLGVAGNFTGHLEQAGESPDFTGVKVAEEHAPKGIFPFYVPSSDVLGEFPLSSEKVILPEGQFNLQIEPEVALICKLKYDGQKLVDVLPEFFAAYNDCSIRKPGAKKISEKKNWGAHSKGLSEKLIAIDRFAPGGIMDNYRIACYLYRDGQLHTYGLDSPLVGYSYFYDKLIAWIVEKINTQQDVGPLENIAELVKLSGFPGKAVISIGATRYTQYGETTFLQKNDRIYVAVYDSFVYNSEQLEEALLNENYKDKDALTVLKQMVI
jgi:hypothetical protein